MAYYGNEEDYEVPSEPYGEDEGSALEQENDQLNDEMENQNDEQQKRSVEEKILKNKLKLIKGNVAVSGKSVLSSTEQKNLKKAKQFPNLKKDIRDIELLLKLNLTKKAFKAMSSSPMLMYVGIGALFIFLIIAIIAFIGALMPWLFPDENNPDGGSVNSIFGVTGVDFYGVRMIYADDEKSTQAIVKDYVEFVETGILQATQTTTISTVSGTFDVSLTINHITLPDEQYDYSTYEESQFMQNNQKLHEIVLNIAKEVYKVDVGSDYSGAFLTECVNSIKYFGFPELTTIAPLVADEIVTAQSITVKDEGGNPQTVESSILEEIETAIEESLVQTYTANTNYLIRTEKLFVKDYILEGDDARVSGLTKEKYVGMIFMPKRNVVFKSLYFAVGNGDLTGFKITMQGDELRTDGNNLGTEDNPSYVYGTGDINLSVAKFEAIDESNLNALASGMSLFDIVETVDNYSIYLEEATDENSVTYLTLIKNDTTIEMENNDKFCVVEYETRWE